MNYQNADSILRQVGIRMPEHDPNRDDAVYGALRAAADREREADPEYAEAADRYADALADEGCGGCENGEHCGACPCCSKGAHCPFCGGPSNALGQLGQRWHYRCRDCGLDFSEEPW